MEKLQDKVKKILASSNDVELEFFSTYKFTKFFIYKKDKVVSEYYHTLLLREWIKRTYEQGKRIDDELMRKIQGLNLLDTEITYNEISFVNKKTKEYYEIDIVDNLVFDSFESAFWYLANHYKGGSK